MVPDWCEFFFCESSFHRCEYCLQNAVFSAFPTARTVCLASTYMDSQIAVFLSLLPERENSNGITRQ